MVDTPAHSVEELEAIRTPFCVNACCGIGNIPVGRDTVHDQCLTGAVLRAAIRALMQGDGVLSLRGSLL
eukprot:8656712-Alexandrium_andersonii.AAC.1